MDSFVGALSAPAQALRPTIQPRGRFRLRSASVALTFSIVCHLGLGLLATRHFRATAIAPELRPAPSDPLRAEIEVLAEPDLEPPTPAVANTPRPTAAATEPTPSARPLTTSPRTAVVTPATKTGSPAAEPEPVAALPSAPEPRPARFTISLTPTVGRAPAQGADSTLASPAVGNSSAPVSAASVDVPARLREGAIPTYTAAALAAGIEANVALEIVVSESGAVSSVRELEHVGYGLDEAARRSVLGYRFTPATRAGKAVAVRMRWSMRFQLR